MSGKEDASAGGDDGSQEPCQLANSGRMYWRSTSWLSSRTSLPPPNPDIEKDGLDPNEGGCCYKLSEVIHLNVHVTVLQHPMTVRGNSLTRHFIEHLP
ncbi:hypothetical protein FXO38_27329 [Capsicum annuum]|nr:hypothetical protein FXO38_27329 [Capsicum annuum]